MWGAQTVNSPPTNTAFPTVKIGDMVSSEVQIVVPTLNEVGNIAVLIGRLEDVLAGVDWELTFVDDDSKDGTYEEIVKFAEIKNNIKGIRRVGRRGLASACIEGMGASTAPIVVVMDADLQHDEALIPKMVSLLKAEQLDIVSASRFAAGARLEGLSKGRQQISRLGNRMANYVMRASLSDPLTGFFAVRRQVIDKVAGSLSLMGFKLLVDIYASSPVKLSGKEIPMTFRDRQHGESKLNINEFLDFGFLLLDKLVGRFIPIRFMKFTFVGFLGLLVHMASLALLHKAAGFAFIYSQAAATYVAMTSTFVMNNAFTFNDRRLEGSKFAKGLFFFYAICTVGALLNLALAGYSYGVGAHWLISGFLGACAGAVWNYAINNAYTWKLKSDKHASLN